MPNRYTLAEYVEHVLKPMVSKVTFSEIHVHGTWKPTIADYKRSGGAKLVEAMRRFHKSQGWSDIAQHATIDPDGYIWSGRDLLCPPASASGFNDPDSDRVHPFMFEMIGNFDAGKEKLEGAQLQTAAGLCFAIMQLWRRGSDMVRFHREFTTLKTCPGSGIDKKWFIQQVMSIVGNVPKQVSPPSSVRVLVNGKPVEFIEKDGRIYVQLKALEDTLGGDLRWDAGTKTASLSLG